MSAQVTPGFDGLHLFFIIPPLRERQDDILPLTQFFLERFTPPGLTVPRLSPEAMVALLKRPWRGNVRELRNGVERALAFSPHPNMLTMEHFRF
ncbi:MAG: hypothetical protein GY822_02105 [Deltaproteobacteria bacterium]|nr:hypothetical protein [Deltaproteobacteria bacterium]